MKSKNSSFNQNNHECEKCAKKPRKMHKLCIKLSACVSKNLNSKDLKRIKSMQIVHKFEFKFK